MAIEPTQSTRLCAIGAACILATPAVAFDQKVVTSAQQPTSCTAYEEAGGGSAEWRIPPGRDPILLFSSGGLDRRVRVYRDTDTGEIQIEETNAGHIHVLCQ